MAEENEVLPTASQSEEALAVDDALIMAGASGKTQVKVNKLPAKILLSAGYSLIVNSKPKLRTPPQEGYIPWIEFGLMFHYRTSFYEKGLVTSNYEQVLSVAPNETIEIGIEVTRRSTLEEENEAKFQMTDSSEASSSLTSEFTDRVSRVIQTTNSSSASMNASGGTGVFNVGGSVNSNYNQTKTDSAEKMKRTVNESSQRVAQEIMKSQVFRTRRTEELTSRDYYRRLIENKTEILRHYGLRRLQQRYLASSQARSPRLVWQFLVYDPGQRLATPRILTEDLIPSALLQAGAREVRYMEAGNFSVSVDGTLATPGRVWVQSIYVGLQYRVIGVQFMNGGDRSSIMLSGKDVAGDWSYNGLVRLEYYRDAANNPGLYEFAFSMLRTSFVGKVPNQINVVLPKVQVILIDRNLEVIWKSDPGLLSTFLPKYRKLLADSRSIKPRPSGDLRREERDEVVSRAFDSLNLRDTLFGADDVVSVASLFDMETTFYQLIPPYVQSGSDMYTDGVAWGRQYDALTEAEPAPLGSSIGWKIQADGDARRNEFINSALARVCIPIQKGMERKAIEFLESKISGDVSPEVMAVVTELELRWTLESDADLLGQKESAVDPFVVTPPIANPPPVGMLAKYLYPVVDLFEVNEPTQGFVYVELELPS